MKSVMVTGCFDGLHAGHVSFLLAAARFGTLNVGVGSDENIRLLKGADRPFFPQWERTYMLRSLYCVKRVFVNSGSGVLDFIEELCRIRPDIFIVADDQHSLEKEEAVKIILKGIAGAEYRVLTRSEFSVFPDRSSTKLFTSKLLTEVR